MTLGQAHVLLGLLNIFLGFHAMTFITIGGVALIAFYMLALGLANMGDDEDDLDDDHSASSELRCVTKITTQTNQEGFWI